jgi:hypothetical protein
MPRIYHDKFKMCREFIIMINSDVFKNLLILHSKFKGGAHAGENEKLDAKILLPPSLRITQ